MPGAGEAAVDDTATVEAVASEPTPAEGEEEVVGAAAVGAGVPGCPPLPTTGKLLWTDCGCCCCML